MDRQDFNEQSYMLNKKKLDAIMEDLIPLYNEGLLSAETTEWFEEQVRQDAKYKQLVTVSQLPLPKQEIEPPVNSEQMLKKINRKLSTYQLIFMAISFYLAINTSILNESFGFILWYAVLGLVTYLFYQDMKMVFLISFFPIFMWSIGSSVVDFFSERTIDGIHFGAFLWQSIAGAVLLSGIHYLFAVIGSVIGLLIYKLKEKG